MASRVVRCGIVSSAVERSIAVESISALIPARAVALSLMSTKEAPPSSSAAAISSIPRWLPPSGGSSWTEVTQ